MVELTEADDGKHLRVPRGDMVLVTLAETPTTGYRWEVVDLDASVVSLERVSYERSPSAAVGGGGRRGFVFAAHSRGTASVTLVCRRSWEPETPLRRFAVTLEVADRR